MDFKDKNDPYLSGLYAKSGVSEPEPETETESEPEPTHVVVPIEVWDAVYAEFEGVITELHAPSNPALVATFLKSIEAQVVPTRIVSEQELADAKKKSGYEFRIKKDEIFYKFASSLADSLTKKDGWQYKKYRFNDSY